MRVSKLVLYSAFLFTIQFVFADPPDWQDDPGSYEFVNAIPGAIVLNVGVQMGDTGDIFAAFDDQNNVRGVAIMLTPPFGPYQGTPLWEITLRSNDDGDILSFKYYDFENPTDLESFIRSQLSEDDLFVEECNKCFDSAITLFKDLKDHLS